MTFEQIKKAIKDYCHLQSQEADTRVGEAINRHYRRVTSTCNIDTARFVTRSVSTTTGVRTVTFSNIEKIDRVIDATDSDAIRMLSEISMQAQRSRQPSAGQPETWALQASGASSVTILLDTVPQEEYDLQADGWSSLADLQANDEPAFPESFHDILVCAVLAEELLRKEKADLADRMEAKSEKLLSELRYFLVDTADRDTRQGSTPGGLGTGGTGGGGGGSVGGSAYTQTALVTFDLGASVAPFAVAQATAAVVTNLDADELDGEHGSFYLDRANHTGALQVEATDLVNLTTNTLVGRDTAGTGAGEQITLGADLEMSGAQVLRVAAFTGDVTKTAGSVAMTIASDAVTTAKILDDNVTDAKIRNSAACSVIGRSANSTGNPADITSSTNSTVLARISDALTWVAGLVFDGAGKVTQIAFPASQSAASDANTLDDYEEGSHTPTDASGAALSFTTAEGAYVKVGQLVHVSCIVTYPSTADGTAATVSLPFTVQDTTNDIYTAICENNSGTTVLSVRATNNTAAVTVKNAASGAAITNANLSTLTIRFSLTYRATA
jgi:hypothetical protein